MITITDSQLLELASELAHERTKIELNITDDEMYSDATNILTYKDDVQDVFNTWYDYYLSKIEETLLDEPGMPKYLSNVVEVKPDGFQWSKPSSGWDEIGFDYQIV